MGPQEEEEKKRKKKKRRKKKRKIVPFAMFTLPTPPNLPVNVKFCVAPFWCAKYVASFEKRDHCAPLMMMKRTIHRLSQTASDDTKGLD
jgi:hypothetical protein